MNGSAPGKYDQRHETSIRRRTHSRTKPFKHPLFPKCGGHAWWSGGHLEPNRKAKEEFLMAYFHINQAYHELVTFRKRRGGADPPASERRILQKIERVLIARERLEDRYAARGIFVIPEYCEGFTVNLVFKDSPSSQTKSPPFTSSASVKITLFTRPKKRTRLCKG